LKNIRFDSIQFTSFQFQLFFKYIRLISSFYFLKFIQTRWIRFVNESRVCFKRNENENENKNENASDNTHAKENDNDQCWHAQN
jgi:hypothetical protein